MANEEQDEFERQRQRDRNRWDRDARYISEREFDELRASVRNLAKDFGDLEKEFVEHRATANWVQKIVFGMVGIFMVAITVAVFRVVTNSMGVGTG